MAILEWQDIRITVDDDGFMEMPTEWNERTALALASTEGLHSLTDDHWKVINYLRTYYTQYGIAPMVRRLCKETGLSLQQIYELFPSGPAKGACKVAGLARPTGCV
jgi:TusE/DsrC/DsvC family sulfur relay protein